jgi:hypothetical protein
MVTFELTEREADIVYRAVYQRWQTWRRCLPPEEREQPLGVALEHKRLSQKIARFIGEGESSR